MPKAKPPFFETIEVSFNEDAKVPAAKQADYKKQARDILTQARQIYADGAFNATQFFGLTYSANSKQAEKIHALYEKIDQDKINSTAAAEDKIIKILTPGSNQAGVVREIMELLKKDEYEDLRGFFRILPVTTMNPDKTTADNADIQRDLQKVNEFVANRHYVIGWRNQLTPAGEVAIGGGEASDVLTKEQSSYIQEYFTELEKASKAQPAAGEEKVDIPEVQQNPAAKKADAAQKAGESTRELAKFVKKQIDDNIYNLERIRYLINTAQKQLDEKKSAELMQTLKHCEEYERQFKACLDTYSQVGETYRKAKELYDAIKPLTIELQGITKAEKLGHHSDKARVVAKDEISKELAILCPNTIINPNDDAFAEISSGPGLLKASDPFNGKARLLVDKVTHGYSVAIQQYTSPDTLRMDFKQVPQKKGINTKGTYQAVDEMDPYGRKIPSDEILIDTMKKMHAMMAAAPPNSSHSPVKMNGNFSTCHAMALMMCIKALGRNYEPQTEKLKKIKIHDDQMICFTERVRAIVGENPELRTLFTKHATPADKYAPEDPSKQTAPPSPASPPAGGQPGAQPQQHVVQPSNPSPVPAAAPPPSSSNSSDKDSPQSSPNISSPGKK